MHEMVKIFRVYSYVCVRACQMRVLFGGFQIVLGLEDTCVEVYAIINGQYRLRFSGFMHQFDLLTYTSSVGVRQLVEAERRLRRSLVRTGADDQHTILRSHC